MCPGLAQTRWLTGGSGHSDLGAAPSRIRDQAVHSHITRAALPVSSRRRTVGISHGGSQSRNLHPCTYSVTSWLFVGDSAYYCTLCLFKPAAACSVASSKRPRTPRPCSETLPIDTNSLLKRRSIGRLPSAATDRLHHWGWIKTFPQVGIYLLKVGFRHRNQWSTWITSCNTLHASKRTLRPSSPIAIRFNYQRRRAWVTLSPLISFRTYR